MTIGELSTHLRELCDLPTRVAPDRAGCPLTRAAAVTIGERNSRCRELVDSCGAAGQTGWGITPSDGRSSDRWSGDSQFADLKCSQEAFADPFCLVGKVGGSVRSARFEGVVVAVDEGDLQVWWDRLNDDQKVVLGGAVRSYPADPAVLKVLDTTNCPIQNGWTATTFASTGNPPAITLHDPLKSFIESRVDG